MAEIIDLNINIGANTTDFEGSLIKAQNLLRQFEAALKKATNVGEINYLNTQIKNLNGTITSLNQKMNTVGRPTADATNALSNLSRVAQDAPYGFIGIANNLNPLLESFQRLSKESGSSTQALKSMAAGLVGPAGIGLALGVVSSLAVTFSDEISAFFKGPTEKLKTFREELNKLNQDIYKIVGEAQSNRTIGLNLVNIIAGGDTKQQEEALKKLKALYSDNKAIKDATIQTDQAYLIHLVNVAAIQEDAAGKEKNSQQVLSAAYAERAKILKEQKNQIGVLKPIVIESAGIGTFGGKFISVESQKATLINKNKPLLDTLDGIIASAKAKNLELNNTLTGIETTDGKGGNQRDKKDPFAEITKDFDKSLKAQETLRTKGIIDQQTYLDNVYKIYEDYIKKLAELDTKQATNKIENLLPKFDKMTLEKNAKEIKDGIKKGLATFQAPELEAPPVDPAIEEEKRFNKFLDFITGHNQKKADLLKQGFDDEKKKIEDLQKSYEDFAYTVSQTVTSSLFSMYDAMQQGASATQALGDMFTRLLRQMAEMVVQAAIFAGILSLISGGAGAKGGVSFLGAFSKILGIPKMADGGIATGATLAMIGEGSESEAVLPLSKLGNIMRGSFNAGSMNSTSGNGLSQFVLRGQDLLLSVNRAQKASNLKGQNISLA
jgi:hypothetical protein